MQTSNLTAAEISELLLRTSKKMNYALAKKKYKTAYSLLKISNIIRMEIGLDRLSLPTLEKRFTA
jgi:hypothetical protein